MKLCRADFLITAIAFANGMDCPHAGQFLKFFDFEYDNGLGYGEFTWDPKEAKRFSTTDEAFMFYLTTPKNKPIREDGRPNRPLTSLTIMIEPYEALDEFGRRIVSGDGGDG